MSAYTKGLGNETIAPDWGEYRACIQSEYHAVDRDGNKVLIKKVLDALEATRDENKRLRADLEAAKVENAVLKDELGWTRKINKLEVAEARAEAEKEGSK
jgi:hypothetical protein